MAFDFFFFAPFGVCAIRFMNPGPTAFDPSQLKLDG